MRMIARCPFNDAEAGTLRRTGDTFDCSEERARRLVALRLAAVAKDQEAAEQAPVEPADEQGETEQTPVEPVEGQNEAEQAPVEPIQEKKQPKKASVAKGKGKASPKKTK